MQETRFNPRVGKIPLRRERLPTLVFWPGEFHGLRSLTRRSPWCHRESDTTERPLLSVNITHLGGILGLHDMFGSCVGTEKKLDREKGQD